MASGDQVGQGRQRPVHGIEDWNPGCSVDMDGHGLGQVPEERAEGFRELHQEEVNGWRPDEGRLQRHQEGRRRVQSQQQVEQWCTEDGGCDVWEEARQP